LSAHVFHAFADAQYNSAVTRMAGVMPLSEPLKAKSLFTKLGLVDLEEYKKRKLLKKSFADSEMIYPINTLEFKGENQKPFNIIWLVVDSLRSDMLAPDIMPNTYALSQRSVVFKNHFSNSNSTRHGIFGLFYGLPGAYFEPALRSQTPPVFVHKLVESQHEMYIYANAPLTKPEFDQTVFVDVKNLRKKSQAKTVDGRDIEINNLLIQSLKNHKSDQPFFSFLFYDAPHGYAYPANYKKPFAVSSDQFNYLSLNVNSDPTQVRAIYKNSVHFVDSLIGQVLETLKAQNLFESTIILVTGDHGQEFNDTKLGYWGHNSNYSQYQTQVPLVIYWPGKKAQEITYMTSHFDISTTFMQDYFKVSNQTGDFSSGFNLFDSQDRKWILMGREGDYAVFQKDQIIVVSPTGDYELLDPSYRPLDRSQMRTEYVQEALREMSRFLAK
ncbi:MAG: sulfatase-like hydrolase/transferase, partial [Bdellovibrionota bacterium]